MDARRELADVLEAYYRGSGWSVEHCPDGTVRATGLGGVTWIGLPVVATDLDDPRFAERLRDLSEVRMPSGERCPLELLPDSSCASRLVALLEKLRLAERGHVEVYARAA